MGKSVILIIFFFLVVSTHIQADSCNEHKAFQVLDDQIIQVKAALKGEKGNSNLLSVFGANFVLSDTEKMVSNLQEKVEKNQGLLLEYESLSNCLEKNKNEKALAKLKLISTELVSLKIELLNKNKQLNNAIVNKLKSENDVPDIKESIQKENKNSEKEKKSLASEILEVESAATKSNDSQIKRVAAYRSELTKLKIEIINKKIDYNNSLEKKLKNFDEQSAFLSVLLGGIKGSSKAELKEKLDTVEKIWTEFMSKKYDLFKVGESFVLPAVPPLSSLSVLNREDLKQDIVEVGILREDIIQLKQDTLKELTLKKNQEIKLHNDFLVQVNNARGVLYGLAPPSLVLNQIYTLDYYSKLFKELTSSPFRVISYFYSKFLYIREEISRGREGIKNLSYDFLYLLFFALILFTIKFIFSKSKYWIDDKIISLLTKFQGINLVKRVLITWNKLKDNTAEILWLVLIYVVKTESFLSEIRILLDFAQVILVSKLLKSMIVLFFGSVSRIDIKSFKTFKMKAQMAANYFTNIYIFYNLSLIVVDATVGRTYIFSLVKIIAISYSIYRLILTSAAWEGEFWTYLERNFSGFVITRLEKLFKFFPQKIRATIYFFIIIIFSILNMFIKATENFEISKKISANIFKKQIESVESESNLEDEVPEEYKQYFQLNSIDHQEDYVCVSEELEKNINKEVSDWINGISDEHSLVVYGDKGVGKTTLANHCLDSISNEYSEQVHILKVKVPAKITNRKDLQQFISGVFQGNDTEKNFDLYQIDNKLEKKVIVFLDEAQNTFLSQIGGFNAYEYFLSLINFNTENIFWVMSFNKYSWLYLDRAFGRNQFFRNVFEIKGWSDLKIKELIMGRHGKSDFKLSFDLLINATRSQDEIDRYASVESKFFKLLWELSRGNPRAALYLWITALSKKRSKVFNVNIPKEIDLAGIEKLPDDLMFVVAYVLKHENLTAKEIEQTTNLPSGIVRNAIKVGLEKDFLFRDDRHRYMIDIASQYGVIKFLTVKNFIYGS